MALSHKNGVALSGVSALNGIAKASIAAINGQTIAAAEGGAAPTYFDALYPSGLTLGALSNGAITSITRPASRAAGIGSGDVQWTGTLNGEKCFKITDRDTDGNDSPETHMRHEYSRRFATNCDDTLYIAYDANGYWRLYHGPNATAGTPFQPITASGTNGYLSGLAGLDVEPDWSVDDPLKLGFWGGGLIHYWKTLSSLGATTVSESNSTRVDFTGRLPWASAEQAWTKSEGMSDAAQRYYCFMATRYDSGTATNIIYGLFTWDSQTDSIVGTRAAATWGSDYPDHCSMSATGTYAVPSWAYPSTVGTRAMPRDLSTSGIELRNDSQHSDCCLGPSGEDFLVYSDYNSGSADDGYVVMVNMATGTATRLFGLYFNSGSTAVHISGKAFERPGWAVISTYADYSNYVDYPADPQQSIYRKVFLCELHSSPVMLDVTHTQENENYGGYFGEPQATTNRWLTFVIWASNFNDATSTNENPKVESAMVALHSESIPAARTS